MALDLTDQVYVERAGGVRTLAAIADFQTPIGTGLPIVNPSIGTPATPVAVEGAVGTVASGTLTMAEEKIGPLRVFTFTLTLARMTVTDAAGSGSSGSLKLADLSQGAWVFLGCRQNYTAFAEGAALTGGAGDAAFVMGLGTVAANAGDGALTGTEVDIGSVTGTITLSGGTGTGTKVSGELGAVDGTSTASDILLNWSGTAATIDANSTIDITGTITVVALYIGDD